MFHVMTSRSSSPFFVCIIIMCVLWVVWSQRAGTRSFSLSLSLSVFSQSLSLLSSLSTLDDLILLVFALFLPCCFVAEVYLSMVQTEERGKKN